MWPVINSLLGVTKEAGIIRVNNVLRMRKENLGAENRRWFAFFGVSCHTKLRDQSQLCRNIGTEEAQMEKDYPAWIASHFRFGTKQRGGGGEVINPFFSLEPRFRRSLWLLVPQNVSGIQTSATKGTQGKCRSDLRKSQGFLTSHCGSNLGWWILEQGPCPPSDGL